MKTILVLISIMILGLYSCEKESTSAIQEEQIIDMQLIKHIGMNNKLNDTLLLTKDKIILKYGKITKEEKEIYKVLKDTSTNNINYLYKLINSNNIYEFESKYSGDPNVADLTKYLFVFNNINNSKIIEYKHSENNPINIKKFIAQIDSIIIDYKLKNPLE